MEKATREALQQELERLEKENEELELSEQVDRLKTQVEKKKRSKEDKKVLGVVLSLLLILALCWLGGWIGSLVMYENISPFKAPKFYYCLIVDPTEECFISLE